MRIAVVLIAALATCSCGARTALEDAIPVAVSTDAGVPPDAGDAGSGPVVLTLARDQTRPNSIAVDATRAYWTTWAANTVMACAKDGCNESPTTLATQQSSAGSIAVTATNVAWVRSDGSLLTCSLAGCSGGPTVFGDAQPCGGVTVCQHIAASSDRLFWLTETQVLTCPASGCVGPPTVLASGQPSALVVDATNAYWIDGKSVMACSVNGCGGAPTKLATAQNPSVIAVGGANVYWIDTPSSSAFTPPSNIMQCAVTGCGGMPTTLASGQTLATGIAADAANVYWTDYSNSGGNQAYAVDTGSVLKCSASGCGGKPTVLFSGEDYPLAVTLDATSLYFTNDGGDTIVKLTPK